MSLEACELTVKIGRKTLLDNLSLRAEPGEVLVVIGANGAGKSTLIKALIGEMTLNAGSIMMNGSPLSQWKRSESSKVRAVLPQSSTLNFPFTTLEVVLMGRTPHLKGVEQAIDYEIAHDALKLTGMLDFAEQAYTTLSGGERQRVQLARVLAQIWEQNGSPRYLLVDEPTNNLDLAYQHRTLEIARRFAREGTAVIAVLHDLNLAAQYADRIAVMKAGRCTAMGVPAEVLTPEIIYDAFQIQVMVEAHPKTNYPLIIPVPQVEIFP